MPLLKSKKEKMVKDVEKMIKDSQSVVFVNFHGLNAVGETSLRRDLRDKDVCYKVSRKTLLKRALLGKADGVLPELDGEVAIVYLPAEASAKDGGADQIAPAREVYNFQKAHKGLLNILGGIFEGKFMDSVKMTEIAMIPSREVLLSKLAFLLKSPMQRLAVAVGEVAKKK